MVALAVYPRGVGGTRNDPRLFVLGINRKGQTMGDRNRGLFSKFTVNRNDGSSQANGKHDGCRYFVLDLDHDPHAIPAVLAYAESCAVDGYDKLADDLLALADVMLREQSEET